jgi:hypothetical protein
MVEQVTRTPVQSAEDVGGCRTITLLLTIQSTTRLRQAAEGANTLGEIGEAKDFKFQLYCVNEAVQRPAPRLSPNKYNLLGVVSLDAMGGQVIVTMLEPCSTQVSATSVLQH